ncbi:hypothetical protein HK101_010219 [Irineochytrium annulatum]|nr:hypothetical protein HK101_010219 [Irineochytrium annulatum]
MKLLDDPIVLYRDPITNAAVCFADKCPHRSAPLSVGRIMDSKLECRYHGWQFDAGTGVVDRVPSLMPGKKIPVNAKVRVYPTVESCGWVWVWPGDMEKSEAANIPKFYHMNGGDMKAREGYVDLDIDHSLLLENFLDPSHLPFTHDKTIGKRSNATALTLSCEFKENGSIHGVRSTPEREDMIVGEFEFHPPSCVALKSNVPTGIMDQTFYSIPLSKGRCRFIWLHRIGFLSLFDTFFLSRWLMDWWYPKYCVRIVMEDYEMLKGQQERLAQGASAMNAPVAADLMINTYRNWWRKAMRRDGGPWFKGYSVDIEDIVLDGCTRPCGPTK